MQEAEGVQSGKLKVNKFESKQSYMKFGFENLNVWQKAVQFAVDVIDIIDSLNCDRKHFRLIECSGISNFWIPL